MVREVSQPCSEHSDPGPGHERRVRHDAAADVSQSTDRQPAERSSQEARFDDRTVRRTGPRLIRNETGAWSLGHLLLWLQPGRAPTIFCGLRRGACRGTAYRSNR
jgi:hypothetical protein